MRKIIAILFLILFSSVTVVAGGSLLKEQTSDLLGGRTGGEWTNVNGHIEPTNSLGVNVLIKGSNKYLNFNTTVGSLGYGFRDNAGSMEFKDSGGLWSAFGSGSSGGGSSIWSTTTPDLIYYYNGARKLVVGGNATTTDVSNNFEVIGGLYTDEVTTTGFTINGERFSDLTGTGLSNVGGVLTAVGGSGDLVSTNNLSDVSSAVLSAHNLFDDSIFAVATVVPADKILMKDVSGSNVLKTVTAQSIADLTTGNTNIDTLGTITTGVWNGTAIDISDYTNLTVTSPITLTGDDIGLNQTAITSLGTIGTGVWNGTAIDFSDYTNATADTGIQFTGDAIGFDCSEVIGTGMQCATEAITLDATGDWTGTFDGQEGTYYTAASNINMDEIGTAAYDDIQGWSNGTQSAGVIEGGAITDSGSGQIDISTVNGIVKSTNSTVGANLFFDLAGVVNQALTDETENYISIDYNAGTPQFVIGVTNTANGHTIFNLGKVFKEGTSLDIIDSGLNIYDFNKRVQQHHLEEASLHFVSGAIVGETGTRNISITAGVMYAGLNRIPTDSIDTSGADTFEYYSYINGAWTESDISQIDNLQYNDVTSVGSESLATLSYNRYGVHWVYKGTNGTTYVVYGQDSYTLNKAQSSQPLASLPVHVSEFGVLRAKIIIRKSDTVFTEIESVTDVEFQSSVASNHNELQGLDGGTAGEYYHLTSAEYTELQLGYLLDTDINTYSKLNTIVADQTLAYAGGAFHDGFSDFVANEHTDWRLTTQGTIHATNYVDNNTTYTSSDFTLSDIGGSVTDAQVPNDITITNLSGTNTGDITLAGTPNYLTLSGQAITQTILNIIDDTDLVDGTNLTFSGSTLNVDDAFLLNNGDIGTGVYDFGGATSLEGVNGASPTIDANGEFGFDTTSDQFQYYSTAKKAITPEPPRCYAIENLAAADDGMSMGAFGQAVTITSVWCQYTGTGTTPATISLEDGGGTAMTHNAMTCTALGTPPTAQDVTAANALTATEALAFDVDNAVAPETDYYTICVLYTVTPN